MEKNVNEIYNNYVIYTEKGEPVDLELSNGEIIPNGSICVDTTHQDIYILTNYIWILMTDNTLLSSLTTSSKQITNSDVEIYNNSAFYRALPNIYYTSSYNTSPNLSIVLPDAVGNKGTWFVVEDSLGLTIKIAKNKAEYGSLHKLLYVIGTVGVITKTYFFCDGKKWNIAHTFAPIGGNSLVIPPAGVGNGRKTIVDKYNGDDATAIQGDLNHPYETFTAAILGASNYDIIEVRPGTYDESNIIPPAGLILTINLLTGAYIAPTANGGKAPIFWEETTHLLAGVNFTIIGAGKDVCGFRCKGSSYADTSAIVVSRANTSYRVNNMLCSSWEADYGYTDPNRNSSIFKDVLIDFEIDLYSTNHAIFENCTFLNANMFRRNLGDQKQNISFINCKFIRNVATIAYDTDYSVTGGDANGLDTWHSKPYDGGGGCNILFKGCQFYNNVGGNGITIFGNAGGATKNIILDTCEFYCNNLAKASIVVDGTSSAVSHHWMIQNCISNVATAVINGGTLTNLLTGTGIQVNSNFVIPHITY